MDPEQQGAIISFDSTDARRHAAGGDTIKPHTKQEQTDYTNEYSVRHSQHIRHARHCASTSVKHARRWETHWGRRQLRAASAARAAKEVEVWRGAARTVASPVELDRADLPLLHRWFGPERRIVRGVELGEALAEE
jgi:hypothetical protein